jgi:hypothetical protein
MPNKEDITDMEESLAYKQLRIAKAKSVSNWSLCEKLHHESHELKQKINRVKLESHQLERKQKQAKWYSGKKAEKKEKEKPKPQTTLQSFLKKSSDGVKKSNPTEPTVINSSPESESTRSVVVDMVVPLCEVVTDETEIVTSCDTAEAKEVNAGQGH